MNRNFEISINNEMNVLFTNMNDVTRPSFSVQVLSTGFEHLYTASWQHAISIVFGGKAEIVEEHPFATIGCVDGPIPMPMTVRFVKGVFIGSIKRPNKLRRPNRKNLYARDRGCCQYCGKPLSYDKSTVDHIIPRSRGGNDNWENIVLSCAPCNYKKGNRLLGELDMELRCVPFRPGNLQNIIRDLGYECL